MLFARDYDADLVTVNYWEPALERLLGEWPSGRVVAAARGEREPGDAAEGREGEGMNIAVLTLTRDRLAVHAALLPDAPRQRRLRLRPLRPRPGVRRTAPSNG